MLNNISNFVGKTNLVMSDKSLNQRIYLYTMKGHISIQYTFIY